MKTRLRKIGSMSLIALVVLIGTHKLIIASQIRSLFQRQGLDNIELYVDTVSPSHSVFRDIVFGDVQPLEIAEARFEYDFWNLFNHHINTIVIKNMTVEANMANGNLALHGLDGLIKDFIPQNSDALLPDYLFSPASYFFDKLTIENSKIHYKDKGIEMTIPFTLTINNAGKNGINLYTNGVSGTLFGYSFTSEKSHTTFKIDDKNQWSGPWNLNLVSKNDNEKIILKLSAKGNIAFSSSKLNGTFVIDSTPEMLKMDAELLIQPQKSYISFKNMLLPFAEGTVGLRNMVIPFDIKNTINFSLDCTHIANQQILGWLFDSDKVTADGYSSGNLPMALTRSGTLIIYPGSLNADEGGHLSISPDLIPATNKDIALLRKAVTQFEYDRLAIEVQSAEGSNIAFNLIATGSSPDANKGRPFPLNIELKYNVLKLIDKLSNNFIFLKK